MALIKIVIAHRARLTGEAVAAVLESRSLPCTTLICSNWEQVLKATKAARVELAVLDYNLVPDSYLSLGPQLLDSCPVVLINDHTKLQSLVQKVRDFGRAKHLPVSPEEGNSSVCSALTSRETDIFRLMVDGLSNKQIASKLFITQRTVKFHVSNILKKLNSQSRTEAVAVYLRSLQGHDVLQATVSTAAVPASADDKMLEPVL